MNHDLQAIAETVKDLVGTAYLYFDDALEVGQGYRTIRFWAVCASPSGKVYIMDGGEEWGEVKEDQAWIIEPLLKKVQSIRKQFQLAS